MFWLFTGLIVLFRIFSLPNQKVKDFLTSLSETFYGEGGNDNPLAYFYETKYDFVSFCEFSLSTPFRGRLPSFQKEFSKGFCFRPWTAEYGFNGVVTREKCFRTRGGYCIQTSRQFDSNWVMLVCTHDVFVKGIVRKMLAIFVLTKDRHGNLSFDEWSEELSVYDNIDGLSQKEIQTKIETLIKTLKITLTKFHRRNLVRAQWFDNQDNPFRCFPFHDEKQLLEEQEEWENQQNLDEEEKEAFFIEELQWENDGVDPEDPYDPDDFSVYVSLPRKRGSTNRQRERNKTLQCVQSGY